MAGHSSRSMSGIQTPFEAFCMGCNAMPQFGVSSPTPICPGIVTSRQPKMGITGKKTTTQVRSTSSLPINVTTNNGSLWSVNGQLHAGKFFFPNDSIRNNFMQAYADTVQMALAAAAKDPRLKGFTDMYCNEQAWQRIPTTAMSHEQREELAASNKGSTDVAVQKWYLDIDCKSILREDLETWDRTQFACTLGQVVQHLVRAMFMDADSMPPGTFSLVILMRPPSFQVGADDTETGSFGIHYVMPNCIVEQVTYVRSVIAARRAADILEQAGALYRPPSFKKVSWDCVIDKTIGLRMPYSCKVEPCPELRDRPEAHRSGGDSKEDRTPPCTLCHGRGQVQKPGYYEPVTTLALDGNPDPALDEILQATGRDAFRNKILLCTIFTPFSAKPTPAVNGCGVKFDLRCLIHNTSSAEFEGRDLRVDIPSLSDSLGAVKRPRGKSGTLVSGGADDGDSKESNKVVFGSEELIVQLFSAYCRNLRPAAYKNLEFERVELLDVNTSTKPYKGKELRAYPAKRRDGSGLTTYHCMNLAGTPQDPFPCHKSCNIYFVCSRTDRTVYQRCMCMCPTAQGRVKGPCRGTSSSSDPPTILSAELALQYFSCNSTMRKAWQRERMIKITRPVSVAALGPRLGAGSGGGGSDNRLAVSTRRPGASDTDPSKKPESRLDSLITTLDEMSLWGAVLFPEENASVLRSMRNIPTYMSSISEGGSSAFQKFSLSGGSSTGLSQAIADEAVLSIHQDRRSLAAIIYNVDLQSAGEDVDMGEGVGGAAGAGGEPDAMTHGIIGERSGDLYVHPTIDPSVLLHPMQCKMVKKDGVIVGYVLGQELWNLSTDALRVEAGE